MELDIVTVLAGLIHEFSGIKCEMRKEDKDTDSLWCLYGKLYGYKELLTIMAKACKDETNMTLLNRIGDELCDNLIICIENELDYREKSLKENK